MAQILTICRIGNEWGFRDVTGAEYGRSQNIEAAVEMAEALARRVGGLVQFTAEAEEYYQLVASEKPGEKPPKMSPPARSALGFWGRFRRR